MTLRLHCDKCPTTIALGRRSDAVPADWSKIKMTSGSMQQVMHLCPSCASVYRPESFHQQSFAGEHAGPYRSEDRPFYEVPRQRGRKPASIITLPSMRGRSK